MNQTPTRPSSSPTATFWSARTVGEIIHWHNGCDQYVRCGVIEGTGGQKQAQPVALVGDWKDSDLPRFEEGIWVPTYHGTQATERVGAWQPNPSFVYESNSFHRGDGPDPAFLDPIALLAGPASIDQPADEAALEQASRLISTEGDPQVRLVAAQEFLYAYLSRRPAGGPSGQDVQ